MKIGKTFSVIAWALGLIAFSASANAASTIVMSVANSSPRRTAFRNDGGFRTVAVIRVANTGDAVGRVGVLEFDKIGMSLIAVEILGVSTSSSYDPASSRAAIWLERGLDLAPGESVLVTVRGLLLPDAKEASCAVRGFGGDFGRGEIVGRPASHALVEELKPEGIGNTSLRAMTTASQPAVLGFVVKGDEYRGVPVLIRAVGPGLKRFGVSSSLEDPLLKLFDASGAVLVENDDWRGLESDFAAAGAFPLEKGSRDAAVIVWLMPGAYTVSVKGFGAGQGEVLIETYQLDSANYGKG